MSTFAPSPSFDSQKNSRLWKKQKEERKRKRHTSKIMSEVDVLVVGAGAAGLTAAYFLQQANWNVRILEASSVLGGRLQKDTSLGWPIDIGGEWIHAGAGGWNNNPNELFRDIYNRDFDLNTILDPFEQSSYSSVTDTIVSETVDKVTDYRWKDGTWWDFLNTEVAAKLKDNTIVYDCVVNKIDYSAAESTTATCSSGDAYKAKQVIVTSSIEVLRSGDITFVPDLPQEYKTALGNFNMQPGLKAFLEFSEKFYPQSPVSVDKDEEWYNTDSISASDYGERIFYDEAFGKNTNLNIMGFFVFGYPAQYYVGKRKKFVIDELLAELDGMYDGKATSTFKRAIVQDWPAEPYVRTGYTNNVNREGTTIGTMKTPINDKLYFAGEALPDDNANWGYAHGAALSGKRAANQIMGIETSSANNNWMAASALMIPSVVVSFFVSQVWT